MSTPAARGLVRLGDSSILIGDTKALLEELAATPRLFIAVAWKGHEGPRPWTKRRTRRQGSRRG